MELEELVMKCKSDSSYMGELWERVRPFCITIANQYYRFIERNGTRICEFDDFLQTAYFGLEKAVIAYDIKSEYKFLTYLKRHVKNEINSLIGLRAKPDLIERSCSLDEPICKDNEGSPLVRGDIIPDKKSSNFTERIADRDVYRVLRQAVEKLPEKERECIKMYYFQGLTYGNIADQYHWSTEYVRQYIMKGLRMLRNLKDIKKLSDIYVDSTTNFYRNKSVISFIGSGSSSVEDLVLQREYERIRQIRLMQNAI